GLHQLVHRASEPAWIGQEGGDVAELHARLGIVGDGADQVGQAHAAVIAARPTLGYARRRSIPRVQPLRVASLTLTAAVMIAAQARAGDVTCSFEGGVLVAPAEVAGI